MGIEISTSPGDLTRPNEDWVGAGAGVFVVVDGAGSPPELGSGCRHGVAWYARRLGTSIFALAQEERVDLKSVLSEAIENVAISHRESCDLSHPGTPSAAVAVARRIGGRVQYLVLADCTVLIQEGTGVAVITDRREAVVGDQFRTPGMWTRIGTPSHRAEIAEYMASMRTVRNRKGGFWVAAADPRVAHEAVFGEREVSGDAAVALTTDGASRPFDLFETTTAAAWLRSVKHDGPEALIDELRRIEQTDPEGARWPRAKRHDDASVLVST